ncbi:hypothetical protein TrCOL_g10608 [Triparma columacea]|uniref:15,16-dihydrobiliverdin:ferredoxin oxidoreductase n=1 Tax=Triparma columacea TaxID=722753 RepID=A0A9W7L2A8_9STRA|nr:hypothetical protein TrCOL_g10608 [Triparma columacea]
MDFYKHQMSVMKDLPGLREVTGNIPEEYHEAVNEKKKCRLYNRVFESDHYRKIRILYYDGGPNTQVFNSLLYPRYEHDLPVLGIDFLAFGKKKHLTVMDFQPLHDSHVVDFEPTLQSIKSNYPELGGKMSSKFYDETQFFSPELLFARFEDPSVVHEKLLPAFTEYLSYHIDMIKTNKPNPAIANQIYEKQREYDIYSAERDPATGMFAGMFGKEWADTFVYDHLFELSRH